jgi:hypothetical protein
MAVYTENGFLENGMMGDQEEFSAQLLMTAQTQIVGGGDQKIVFLGMVHAVTGGAIDVIPGMDVGHRIVLGMGIGVAGRADLVIL